MSIFVTSDLHFCHDRGFIYEPRGFATIGEMNSAIVERWNAIVQQEDDVYVLGDLMLNDNDKGTKLISSLKGKLHIVAGNHDTEPRRGLLRTLPNVVEIADALRLKYSGYQFFMTHYPCYTSSLEKSSLKECLINLYGHTHQKTNFFQDIPFMYHVGMDSHCCTPVDLDAILSDIQTKVEECFRQL